MKPETPEAFIEAYERALATQNWSVVEPLIHPDACVTFSNGTVLQGRAAVGEGFSRNFQAIKSERYSISNVRWVRKTGDLAVYVFDFDWAGVIDGQRSSGGGRGTSVLVREDGRWMLLVEHLGPRGR